MREPDVLAVDELSLGLAPHRRGRLAERLARLNRERGLAVLLIEQNARLAFDLAAGLTSSRPAASSPKGPQRIWPTAPR